MRMVTIFVCCEIATQLVYAGIASRLSQSSGRISDANIQSTRGSDGGRRHEGRTDSEAN
ncbi:hypothetical protein TELCIR_20705 [Teladorsagia circumcincta]|uniref:Uncharacterized protein n=1 Tax=Teladorsagia circumcincta TaxID=45464 RepID=A0A2G9TIW0_TELCI|nr:hypothetical protein TELCIR_20705 [Teladorsagia circumcincta]